LSADADRIVVGDYTPGDEWSITGGFDQDGDGFADFAVGRAIDDAVHVVPGAP
jgi:hypothetical protein